MSRARDFANLAGAADAGTISGDNIIINGDMAVWQRGTTIDTITSGTYLCDRWRIAHSGLDGNVDVDRSTDVPSGQGFKYSQKISTDAEETSLDAADQLNLQQRFEGQNLQHILKGTSSAKSLTLSFWVKSSVASIYSVNLRDNDNSRLIGKSYTINAANTWEKKIITFAGDTSGTLDNDNARSLDLTFYIDAGSARTDGTFATSWATASDDERVYATTDWLEDTTSREWYITGVKLEVGTTATPFQHESYGDNLIKCQRYFETNYPEGKYPGDVIGDTVGAGLTYRTGVATTYQNWPFKVRKRANPTMVAYNGLDGGTGDWRGSGSTDFSVTLYDNEEYFSAGIVATDTAIRSAFYTVDAEL
jgi:hypothetical protein